MDFSNIVLNKSAQNSLFFQDKCLGICMDAATNFYNNELRTIFIFLFVYACILYALNHFKDITEEVHEFHEKFFGTMILCLMVAIGILIFMIKFK